MVGPSAICSRHPQRDAVGVCVRCSNAFCSDCLTKLDGINHCQTCLTNLSRQLANEPTTTRRGLPPSLALSLGFLTLALLAWTMLEVMLPGAGSL
ncbi:MAG: hypothetical protein QM778_35410 [Myxococcales bacterium]